MEWSLNKRVVRITTQTGLQGDGERTIMGRKASNFIIIIKILLELSYERGWLRVCSMRGNMIHAKKILLGRFQGRRPIRVVVYRLVCILNRQYVRECLDLSGSARGLDFSSSEHGNMTLCSLRVENCVPNWLTVATVPCGVRYEKDKIKITRRWRKEIYLP